MKTKWLIALLCLSITACNSNTPSPETADSDAPGAVSSDSDSVVPAEPSVAASDIKGLEDQYAAETTAFMAAYRAADEADRKKILEEKYPKTDEYCAKMLKIAESNPDDEAAFQAHFWIAKNSRDEATNAAAYDSLLSKHIDRVELKQICRRMAYKQASQKTEDQLRSLAKDSPHDDVKAMATLSLADYLKRTASLAQTIKDKPDDHNQSDETVAYIESTDIGSQTISTVYQTVIDEYGDIEIEGRPETLGSLAEGALFEMNNLSIGKEVPDIVAEDIDGVEFKLSDYRGKVVVIDFWGDW